MKQRMPWSETMIVLERQTVAEAIDGRNVPGYPRARLEFALQCVETLEKDPSPRGRLHTLLFAQAALDQHAAFGGLTAREVQNLAATGLTILRLMRLDPDKSKLAFLYADLYRALSRIHQAEGRSWPAAWDLWLAGNVVSAQRGDQSAGDLAAKGFAALRRGHTELAMAHFERAESQSASHDLLAGIAVGAARGHRLLGEGAAARAALAGAAKLLGIGPARRHELAWEEVRLAVFAADPDVGAALSAVAKDGPHFVAERLIEATLAAMAAPSRRWLGDLRSMRRLSRYKELELSRHPTLYRAALALEFAGDPAVPMGVRLERIGATLSEAAALPSLEHELLVLAAIARWLARNQAYPLAELALSEYRGLSLKASGGRRQDALGFMGDFEGRGWLLSGNGRGAA